MRQDKQQRRSKYSIEGAAELAKRTYYGQPEPTQTPSKLETRETAPDKMESEQQADTVADKSRGGLPPEVRRALTTLLRHGVIMAANKRLLLDTLCHYPRKIS